MGLSLRHLIESWILPPGSLILLVVAGLVLLPRQRRLSIALLSSAVGLLYLLSTAIVSQGLVSLTQSHTTALDVGKLGDYGAQAIIVLAAGRNIDAPEFGGEDTVSKITLERVRYGAFLHKRTGLPILVSGGSPFGRPLSLAELMARSLREDFGVADVWLEDKSNTTQENARFSHDVLTSKGIKRVFVVSQAWHLDRAVPAFEKAGFEVIPAPTAFQSLDTDQLMELVIPNATALQNSAQALHELIGTVWYWIRY